MFEIGETKKCFYYEVIKIRNGLPSEISRVLQRLFNNQCSDASHIEVDTQQDQGFIAILRNSTIVIAAHGLSRSHRGTNVASYDASKPKRNKKAKFK